jgi:hypothetical protein
MQTVLINDESTFHLQIEDDQATSPTDVGSLVTAWQGLGIRLFPWETRTFAFDEIWIFLRL